MALCDVSSIEWSKTGKQSRVYKFGRGRRKVNCMKALVGGEVCFGEAKEKWST